MIRVTIVNRFITMTIRIVVVTLASRARCVGHFLPDQLLLSKTSKLLDVPTLGRMNVDFGATTDSASSQASAITKDVSRTVVLQAQSACAQP